ncbi:MAG: ROK family protein, partial [Actinomycetota bacterium]
LEFVDGVSTPVEDGLPAIEGAIFDTIDRLIAVGRQRSRHIRGLGVGIPGVVDEAKGLGVLSANLRWERYPVREILEARTELPVRVGHDVRLGALAELVGGAAAGVRDFVFVALGTGIGAAVVTGKRPYPGAHGAAAELGHLRVSSSSERCGCGRTGCLETIAGGAAIRRRYGSGEPGPAPSPEVIAERWRSGDRRAARVWNEAVEALAKGLAHCTLLYDPERIVIAGGMSALGDQLLDPLRAAFRQEMQCWTTPSIVASTFGSLAGCAGAGIAGWQAVSEAE